MPSPAITPYVLSPNVADLIVVGGRVAYRDESQRRRKVAICGAGGQRQMPWDDPTYECWSINNFYNSSRDSSGRYAASRHWEQHQVFPDRAGRHAGQVIQDANDIAWLRECPVPIYTTEPFPENPRAVVYPLQAYVDRGYRDYFCCTFAYQILQAHVEGFEELLVCGLELLLGTKREATFEAACVAYWLGFVEGRGMRVTLAPAAREWATFGPGHPSCKVESRQLLLYHPYRYGHQYWDEADFVKSLVERWNDRPTAI